MLKFYSLIPYLRSQFQNDFETSDAGFYKNSAKTLIFELGYALGSCGKIATHYWLSNCALQYAS